MMLSMRSGSEAERTAVIEGAKGRKWRGGRRGEDETETREAVTVVAASEHQRARGSCLCVQ